MDSKGQIKMFETLGVLVVFFFLLAVGFAFYFQAQKSSIMRSAEVGYEQQAFNTALKAMYLPELDCSFLSAHRENCVDLMKAREFAKLKHNASALQFYYEEFGDAKIVLREVYPGFESIVLYDNPPPELSQQIVIKSPILIYDALTDTYKFGLLEVLKYV